MRADPDDEQHRPLIVDFRNQPDMVAFDVENDPRADKVRAVEGFADIRRRFPGSVFDESMPSAKRRFCLPVPLGEDPQRLPRNHPHAGTLAQFLVVRKLNPVVGYRPAEDRYCIPRTMIPRTMEVRNPKLR